MRLFSLLFIALFIFIGCATPEERQAKLELKKARLEKLQKEMSKLTVYSHDNPERCSAFRDCKYLLTLRCFKPEEIFDDYCSRYFKQYAVNYGGDTVVYTSEPERVATDNLLVRAEIYQCEHIANKPDIRTIEQFAYRGRAAERRTKIINSSYDSQCGISDLCVEMNTFKCTTVRGRPTLRCDNYLQKNLYKTTADLFVISDHKTNPEGRYSINGMLYKCPESKSSLFPKYKRVIKNRKSDYEPKRLDIDSQKITGLNGHATFEIVNKQLSKDVYLFDSLTRHFITLDEPSEMIKESLVHELSKKGFQFKKGGEKKISFSLDSIQRVDAQWHIKVITAYTVELSNGKSLFRAREFALFDEEPMYALQSKIVVDILNDPEVREFLVPQ